MRMSRSRRRRSSRAGTERPEAGETQEQVAIPDCRGQPHLLWKAPDSRHKPLGFPAARPDGEWRIDGIDPGIVPGAHARGSSGRTSLRCRDEQRTLYRASVSACRRKFKLDENLGQRAQARLLAGGTTVQTAADEGLRGAEDERIHAVCRAEQRCLITLDLDFIDVVRFPAIPPAGLVVLRPPRRTSQAVLLGLLEQMLSLVGREPLAGQIWILEVGRVRIRDQQRT